MACPTCGHAMFPIGECVKICPRCGTSIWPELDPDLPPRVYVPKLVERCRHFEQACVGKSRSGTDAAWKSLGIAESIALPEDRK